MNIKCCKCNKKLGEITKGKLHKEIKYICSKCMAAIEFKNIGRDNIKSQMDDLFGGIFK